MSPETARHAIFCVRTCFYIPQLEKMQCAKIPLFSRFIKMGISHDFRNFLAVFCF